MNKIKTKKHRNYQVMNMLLHTKPGPHSDSRKEKNKTECRGKVDIRKNGW